MSISHANTQLHIGSSERKYWNSNATTIQLFHHLFNGFYQTIASHHLPTIKKKENILIIKQVRYGTLTSNNFNRV